MKIRAVTSWSAVDGEARADATTVTPRIQGPLPADGSTECPLRNYKERAADKQMPSADAHEGGTKPLLLSGADCPLSVPVYCYR